MEIFQFFDRSSNNKITIEDVREVIAREGRKLQETELEDIMMEISMDRRGSISFELFKIMM